jgi:type II secretory pathway component GspD/PulD (secretin)
MRYAGLSLALTLIAAGGPVATAQPAKATDAPAPSASATKPASETSAPIRRHDDGTWPTHTFYLKYTTSQSEMNEIATTLRILLAAPDMTFVLPSKSAIVVHAFPDDIALAQKLLDDLDRPEKAWRLTYTVTEMDGDKRLGTEHYSMDMVDGQEATLKQGSRVPIALGMATDKDSAATARISYQDIGMSFDATLNPQASGARLKSAIERTAIATLAANGTSDPVFRNSSIKGAYLLAPGKPLVLGTMDIPDSTHSLQIEVLMEPLP